MSALGLPLANAILSLAADIIPLAQGLTVGRLEAQQAREQLGKALEAHQQQLATIDAQLRGNDAAADAAARLLPEEAPAAAVLLAAAAPAAAPPAPVPAAPPPVTPAPDAAGRSTP